MCNIDSNFIATCTYIAFRYTNCVSLSQTCEPLYEVPLVLHVFLGYFTVTFDERDEMYALKLPDTL